VRFILARALSYRIIWGTVDHDTNGQPTSVHKRRTIWPQRTPTFGQTFFSVDAAHLSMSTSSMRVVVADGEPDARRRLHEVLTKKNYVRILAECSDGLQAAQAIARLRPDVAFLDVKMAGLDGLAVCDQLAGLHAKVVFVTAHSEYAVRAFELCALDYVLKPYADARLFLAVERARAALRTDSAGTPNGELRSLLRDVRTGTLDQLAVRSKHAVLLVPIADIDWIEGADDYVRVHAAGQAHLIRSTMAEMERRLPADHFVRVQRAAIVNVLRVRELRNWLHKDLRIVLNDGTLVPLSQRYRKALAERLRIDL
jgi:two-component system LytT family response regulator